MARNEVDGVLAKRHTVDCQYVLFNSGEAMPAIRDRIEGIRNRCRLCLGLNIQRISVIDDRVLIAMQDQQGRITPGDQPAIDEPAPVIDQHVRLRRINCVLIETICQVQGNDGTRRLSPDRKLRCIHTQLILMVFDPAQGGCPVFDGAGENIGLGVSVRPRDPGLA